VAIVLRSYLSGDLFKKLRKRKGLRQVVIQNMNFDSHDSQVTLSRIENLKQDPKKDTLTDLLAKVNMPYEEFFCPYMETQAPEAFILTHQIAYLLERAEGDEKIQCMTQELIQTLKSKLDMDSIVNKQLWISLQARLDIMTGDNIQETLNLVKEGLKLTYPEFDEVTFDGDMLIFYEGELMLALASCYASQGETRRAIDILRRTKEGWSKLPYTERSKDIVLCRLCNMVTAFLLEAGEYSVALTASDEGLAIAKRESRKVFIPHALYLRGLAIFYNSGDKVESMALLRQSYFAFALLQMDEMKRRVLHDAQTILGGRFDTCNAESMAFELPADFNAVISGGALAVDSIGALMRQFREAVGLKPIDVYRGICSQSFYSRIESGERSEVSIFILEALMQRLGRDINLYFNCFPSVKEYAEFHLRIMYLQELHIGNIEQAMKAYEEFIKMGDYTQGLRLQFLLFCDAIKHIPPDGSVNWNCLDMLDRAIKVTIPNYDEENIRILRLTNDEVQILNLMAWLYTENGQLERGLAIFTQIRESMLKSYVDDYARAKYYHVILDNLASCHDKQGNYESALEYINERENLCVRYGLLNYLNVTAHRKAVILHHLGRRKEAVAYLTMAYYSGNLTASPHMLQAVKEFARDEAGIELSNELGFVFYENKDKTYS